MSKDNNFFSIAMTEQTVDGTFLPLFLPLCTMYIHAHTKCRGFEFHLNSSFFFGKKVVSGVVVLCCIAFLSCLNRCLSSTHVVYRCTCTCTCTQCVQLEYTMNGNHIKCHDGN